MELSPGERLIILMLCDLQEKLDVEGEINAPFIRKAILGGHTWALDQEIGQVVNYTTPSYVFGQVADILDVYSVLERAYAELSPEQKAQIPEWQIKFHGFDGNGESEHMSVARFLIHEMRRWEEFSGRELNSHAPTVTRALQMSEAFKPMREDFGMRGALTFDQVVQIVAAAGYGQD